MDTEQKRIFLEGIAVGCALHSRPLTDGTESGDKDELFAALLDLQFEPQYPNPIAKQYTVPYISIDPAKASGKGLAVLRSVVVCTDLVNTDGVQYVVELSLGCDVLQTKKFVTKSDLTLGLIVPQPNGLFFDAKKGLWSVWPKSFTVVDDILSPGGSLGFKNDNPMTVYPNKTLAMMDASGETYDEAYWSIRASTSLPDVPESFAPVQELGIALEMVSLTEGMDRLYESYELTDQKPESMGLFTLRNGETTPDKVIALTLTGIGWGTDWDSNSAGGIVTVRLNTTALAS